MDKQIQRLVKEVADEFTVAHKYYQIISIVNDLDLAEGDIQLISFTAIRGNISDPRHRKEFVKRYKTSMATINNGVYRLKKKNIVHKVDKVLFINPVLTKVDFNKPLEVIVNLNIPQNE